MAYALFFLLILPFLYVFLLIAIVCWGEVSLVCQRLRGDQFSDSNSNYYDVQGD